MSTYTHISFHNNNDPVFLAKIATPAGVVEWEDDHGFVCERPGPVLKDIKGAVRETEAEYGGWVIDLAEIPPGTTHIAIERY